MIRTKPQAQPGPALRAALAECAHHALILAAARQDLAHTPYSADTLPGPEPEALRALDQAAYRFGKLQDTLALRVLPAVLDWLEEPLPPTATFPVKLQRLERLGLIPSVEQWRELRELRNQLAHEYQDAPALKAAALNRFVAGIDDLIALWQHLAAQLAQAGVALPAEDSS